MLEHNRESRSVFTSRIGILNARALVCASLNRSIASTWVACSARIHLSPASARHTRRIVELDNHVRRVQRRLVPVAVYQITRMLPYVSTPLHLLLLPRIRHASSGLAKILVDLAVRYMIATSPEFVEEKAGAQARLFPCFLDRRLLVRKPEPTRIMSHLIASFVSFTIPSEGMDSRNNICTPHYTKNCEKYLSMSAPYYA